MRPSASQPHVHWTLVADTPRDATLILVLHQPVYSADAAIVVGRSPEPLIAARAGSGGRRAAGG